MTQMLSGGECLSIVDRADEDRLPVDERVENLDARAIVYDTALIDHVSDELFDPTSWPRQEAVEGPLRAGGRGPTMIVGDGAREFVLRHYRRGGLAARMSRDRYLWLGAARTRSFAEWRLLARLRALGLPVPRPAAARYVRSGPFYRADLLTLRQPGLRALSRRLAEGGADAAFWTRIGRGLRCFHDAGVCHADLNAYNLQVDAGDRLFLLDFDRGTVRAPGRWQARNLGRLKRSLEKVARLDSRIRYSAADWQAMLAGYRASSSDA